MALRTATRSLRKSVYLYTQFRRRVILRSWPDSRTDGPTAPFRLFVAGERAVHGLAEIPKSEIVHEGRITQPNLRPEAFRERHEFK